MKAISPSGLAHEACAATQRPVPCKEGPDGKRLGKLQDQRSLWSSNLAQDRADLTACDRQGNSVLAVAASSSELEQRVCLVGLLMFRD